MQKILAWSDASTAGTGFGVVSKHVLSALHATGEYEIHHLAINFHGDFVDKDLVPWQVQPARLLDPKDPHGLKMFTRTLMKGNYDIVWILNDLYVTHDIVNPIKQVFAKLTQEGKKIPKIVYYYPVDCHVPVQGSGLVEIADYPVCYTKHGKVETLETLPGVEDKLREIPHGVDTKAFHPLPLPMVHTLKEKFFSVSPETTVVINVNRNSIRKQIQYSMLAFKEFKKKVPDSVMYLHTVVRDQGGDLVRAIEDLGLSFKTDIIFPTKYSPSNPVPVELLNRLYNSADIFLTTHLGEGWGLTITEAMAAGVPVVAPRNTCMPQQLGNRSERGYLYKCNDKIWVDSSGYRDKGLIPDIVDKMVAARNDGNKYDNPKAIAARAWALKHDWKEVTKKWVKLFKEISSGKEKKKSDNQIIMGDEI